MSKVAVVYWSGTGNTEAMANKVAEGAKAAGAEVEVISADDFDGTDISGFDGVAFGCPAMGDEELEDSVFQPVFEACEAKLAGKKSSTFWFLWLGRRRVDAQLGREMPERWRCTCC